MNDGEEQRTYVADEESRGNFEPLCISPPATAEGRAETGEFERHPRIKRCAGLREQLHSFLVMATPYFRENREGRILFAIMVVLTLANSAVRVYFSYLEKEFWNALSAKDADTFYSVMAKFAGSCIVMVPIIVAYRFQRQKLAIAWRKWLTGRILRLYFSNKVCSMEYCLGLQSSYIFYNFTDLFCIISSFRCIIH